MMSGRRWRSQVRECLATFGTLCHLCLHPGASTADHLLPRSRGGSDDVANLRPAHSDKQPCATCGLKCNQVRGNRPITPELLARFRRAGRVDNLGEFFKNHTPGHPAPAGFLPPIGPEKNRNHPFIHNPDQAAS